MEKEFTELLHKHQGIAHKVCSIYFSNRVNKDDYFQELVIQLWKAFPTFKKQSKFSTWMYRVCLNASIDILRKEKSQPTFVQYIAQDEIEYPKEQGDNQVRLYNAIEQLSSLNKAIIILYLEDYSYKEIAEIVGITEGNAGTKINRIKLEIQKILNHGN
ncbi:MAG: RNA polymerase sigma factor [Bacteroidales bacterium]|nr:RNA polymerase sigma factor [Bacteroidales bacterium]